MDIMVTGNVGKGHASLSRIKGSSQIRRMDPFWVNSQIPGRNNSQPG